jgi:hypothetical protein
MRELSTIFGFNCGSYVRKRNVIGRQRIIAERILLYRYRWYKCKNFICNE